MKQATPFLLYFFLCLPSMAQNQGANTAKATHGPAIRVEGNTLIANGVTYGLVKVEADTFTMGENPKTPHSQLLEAPLHKVTLTKDFFIGTTEVTQALWKAVMGNNPSSIKGDNLPVDKVSWNYCHTFIERLNAITGKYFRLPTEAEWEFAARGGKLSKHYKYSGSNDIDEVAWYSKNSNKESHPVAEKLPNELGLYDMTGNVLEWCQDRYDALTPEPQTDPIGAEDGDGRVFRGGDWFSGIAETCHTSYRGYEFPEVGVGNVGFRLVLSEKPTIAQREEQLPEPDISVDGTTLIVNCIPYELVKVKAGTFTMGATPEQKNPSIKEKPAHQVTITKDFYIGKTEVTQAVWKAVMGYNPSKPWRNYHAVENVSWDDCQAFISKLNAATGRKFRLPTEAEWEFAARGGNLSKHYMYSGSNDIDEVGYDGKDRVAMLEPNELGLYDMSGNVWEWCQDWYDSYSSKAQTDPTGPDTGTSRVRRGGGWDYAAWEYTAEGCRISARFCADPSYHDHFIGLRLVLSE